MFVICLIRGQVIYCTLHRCLQFLCFFILFVYITIIFCSDIYRDASYDSLYIFHPHTWVMNKFFIVKSNWTRKLIKIFGLTYGGLGIDCDDIFSFELNLFCTVCFFLFVKYMLTYFQLLIQWFLWKFLASFFVSIMSSYLAFVHSFDWSYHFVFIQGWCHFILVIHFGHTIWFSYRDGAIFVFIFGHLW